MGADLGVGDQSWNYAGLDVVADLNRLPFADAVFDGALNIVTLEHLREPHLAMREMARVLKPGGRLLLIAPHQWEVHQEPHDYFRYTGYGLQWLAEQAGLRVERLDGVGGMFRLLSRRLLGALQFFPGVVRPLAALLFVPPARCAPLAGSPRRQKTVHTGICMRSAKT